MIKFITFDCYDTLVAYSAGKMAAIRDIVREKGGDREQAEAVCRGFESSERSLHAATPFRPLTEVLRRCLEIALSDAGLDCKAADHERVVAAVRDARPFDDVAPVLRQLRRRFKTAILSNSEPQIMAANLRRIDVPFDRVVLAAEVGCYKPDHRMFYALLERCGCDRVEIVHVAQGFYHDIVPGHQLGLRRVWINRQGLDGDPAYGPYDELPDLRGLPALLGTG